MHTRLLEVEQGWHWERRNLTRFEVDELWALCVCLVSGVSQRVGLLGTYTHRRLVSMSCPHCCSRSVPTGIEGWCTAVFFRHVGSTLFRSSNSFTAPSCPPIEAHICHRIVFDHSHLGVWERHLPVPL